MPDFTFDGPNGQSYTISGPDGATPQQAFQMLQTHLNDTAPSMGGGPTASAPIPESQNSLAGSAKAIGSGLVNAGIGMAGLPGDVQATIHNVLGPAPSPNVAPPGVYGSIVGALEKARSALELPTSSGIRNTIESKTGPLNYEPTTKGEGYLQTGAEFAPMLLNPANATKKVLTSIPTIVKKLAETFIPAVASETAGQATAGSDLEPYARIGAGGVTAAGLSKVERDLQRLAINKATPTALENKAAASETYNKLTAANTGIGLDGASSAPATMSKDELKKLLETQGTDLKNVSLGNGAYLKDFSNGLKEELNLKGIRPSNAEGIHSALNEMKTPAIAGKPDVQDLVAARESIKNQLGAKDSSKAGAAMVLPKIEAAIEKFSPGTMADLREADKNYSAFKVSEAVDKKVARAELRNQGAHSGLNLGNKIQQKIGDLLLSEKDARYIPAQVKEELKAIGQSTPQLATRMISNMLGGGGGIGSTLLGLGGTFAGNYTGHPEAALLPVAGLGLRMGYNKSVANQAARVGAAMRARSPLGQARGTPQNLPPGLTPTQAAVLSAFLASNRGQ